MSSAKSFHVTIAMGVQNAEPALAVSACAVPDSALSMSPQALEAGIHASAATDPSARPRSASPDAISTPVTSMLCDALKAAIAGTTMSAASLE